MSHDAVVALRPKMLELRSQTESERKIPQPIVDALTNLNLFRLGVAADVGGLELHPVEALKLYEELAATEASVAWVIWNSSLPCMLGQYLTMEQRREVFGSTDGRYAISTRPTGRAMMRDGSYRVSGRWSLVSGCLHASWIALTCIVEENGQPQMLAPGVPNQRIAYLPATDCRIVDTWHVGGLRGTGSHDVVVDDRIVPAVRTISPAEPSRIDGVLGRVPIIATMSAGHAAISLGIARAATTVVRDLATKKVSVDAGPGLRDRGTAQAAIAIALAKLSAFRSHLHALVERQWEMVKRGEKPTSEQIADVWSTALTTGRECRAIVNDMYETAGTSALYTSSLIERCHRDIHAAGLHVVTQRGFLEDTGRVYFGLDATNPLYAI